MRESSVATRLVVVLTLSCFCVDSAGVETRAALVMKPVSYCVSRGAVWCELRIASGGLGREIRKLEVAFCSLSFSTLSGWSRRL